MPRLGNEAVVVNGLVVGVTASVCKVSASNEHTRYLGFLGHRPC